MAIKRMNALFLGVDQGSHASRALLFDALGNEVASAYETVNLNHLERGYVEQDARQLITSVKTVINKVLQSYSQPNNVVACGIAIQRSSVLSWTADGTANSPVLSWQDIRGDDQLKALQPQKAIIQRLSGLPLSAHYGASKMRWLLDNLYAGNCPKETRLSPLSSFLLYHLVDNKAYRVDHSNAQRTQLMDINTLDWSEQLTQWFRVPKKCLPICMPMCANYGFLKESTIPVKAVCGDQNAALMGVGRITEDTGLVNLGSGAFVLRSLDKNKPSNRQLCSVLFSDGKTVKYAREATINGAGSALTWLQDKFHIQQMQDRLPGWLETIDKPPLFINTIGGLGSPWWRQDIQADFIAADLLNEGSLAVAVIESILFMLQANLELMIAESPLVKLRVSGGLSRLDGLCQKLADLCSLPVERVNNTEATARGVAWLAAGQPSHWITSDPVERFLPHANEALCWRYSQYLSALSARLEYRT